MATLDIDGKNVEVDDSFLELSPREQNDVVGKIASSLGAKSGGDTNSVGSGVANVAKAFGTGVAKGVADVAGLPGDAAGALGGIVDWLAGRAGLPAVSDKAGSVVHSAARSLPGIGQAITLYDLAGGLLPDSAREVINPLRGSEVANRVVQKVTGPYRTSHSVPEQYAETMGRFVPAAAATAGEGAVLPLLRNIGLFGLIPGAASETAGQVFKDGPMETPARVAAGLTLGTLATLGQRIPTAERMISQSLENVTPQQIDQARALFNQARQMGTPISQAEALQAVTNGSTKLGDLQHTIEGMGGMKPFYAQRPAHNDAAARQAFGGIAPQSADPSQLGPAMGEAAGQFVRQSPEANILADVLWRAGPRMTPEQAGNVIQGELGRTYQGREGMRAALAERDYGAARNAPATIPLNGGHRVADVTKHYLNRPDIPILLDPAERAAAKAQWFKDNNPTTRMPIVGERATEFGQVDASAVLRQLDDALDTAKGAVRQGLQAARSALFKPDGTLDMSVAGLHNSRQAIDDLISQAKRAGANQTVMRLQETKRTLDNALEQVPAYGEARTNFQAASRPLEPFDQSRAPGKIIERDEFNSRYVMPPERVPGTIQNNGPSAARDFNSVATPAAREAFEQNIVTQVLDRASREGVGLSSDSIRQALRQNEDLLRQYPGVRDKLESIAIARDGLAKIENSPLGKIAQRDLTTKQAVEALFPSNPVPNSAGEISHTVHALAERNPMVARQLVRNHAEMTFNEAAQRLASGGPNQSGGAKFAAVLRGNSQQAANLEAAVRALPGGDQIWIGFDRVLNVMEAQQWRQATGSRTAFKIPGVEDLKGGGLLNNAAQVAGGAGIPIAKKVTNALQNWNVGRNLDELSRILTTPEGSEILRQLARTPPNSVQFVTVLNRLGNIVREGGRSGGAGSSDEE